MSGHTYWLSCTKLTVYAETDEAGIVLRTAPITRKFIGQDLNNLIRWMSKFSEVSVEKLNV